MLKPNSIVILAILCIVSGCRTYTNIQEYTVTRKVHQFTIDETDLDQILVLFGNDFQKNNWNNYSFEYAYLSEGISFSHKQEDSTKTIQWINIDLSKNKVNIEDKITLNRNSKVSEIVDALGQSTYEYDNSYKWSDT